MMKVRPVSSDDAAALAAIYNHYVQNTVISFEIEPLSEEQMRGRIAQITALVTDAVLRATAQKKDEDDAA